MKNSLILLLLFICCSGLFGQTGAIYVATDGNDEYDGSLSKPFATIHKAIEQANNLRKSGTVDSIQVLIREGTYRIAKALLLNDSTMDLVNKTPILFRGLGNVTISGGKPVVFSGSDNIVSTQSPLDSTIIPSDLYIGGQRATRARTPDTGYWKLPSQVIETSMKGEGNEKPQSTLTMALATEITDSLKQLSPQELKSSKVSVHMVSKWDVTIRYLCSFDPTTQMFTTCPGTQIPSSAQIRKGNYYFVEGYQGALNAPGEWLNVGDALLYHRTSDQQGSDISGVVTSTNYLMVISGNPGNPMSNISFENIHFAYSNLVLGADGWDPVQAAASQSATINVNYTDNLQFDSCSFQHIGQFAIWMNNAVKNSSINHSYFNDLGAGAIKIGSTARGTVQPDSVLSSINRIENNIIHSGGRKLPCAAAIWIGNSADNVVTHNNIGDFNYSGISVGWTLGYDSSNVRNNEISYNEVQYIGGEVMSDMAGIYTMGVSPGTTIHNNVVHDVSGSIIGFGIYLDEGSSYITVKDNLVVRTTQGGFMFHYGQKNQIRNNIFAMGLQSQLYLQQQVLKTGTSFNFDTNLVYFENEPLISDNGDWKGINATFSNNLFLGPDNQNNWKKLIQSNNKLNNIFDKNTSKDSLSTKDVLPFGNWSDSWLSKIKFQSVDWTQAGVTGSEAWKNKAKLPDDIITAFEANNRKLYPDGSMYPKGNASKK